MTIPEPVITDVSNMLSGLIIKSAQFVDYDAKDRISRFQITFRNGTKLNIQPNTTDSVLTSSLTWENGEVELV